MMRGWSAVGATARVSAVMDMIRFETKLSAAPSKWPVNITITGVMLIPLARALALQEILHPSLQ